MSVCCAFRLETNYCLLLIYASVLALSDCSLAGVNELCHQLLKLACTSFHVLLYHILLVPRMLSTTCSQWLPDRPVVNHTNCLVSMRLSGLVSTPVKTLL